MSERAPIAGEAVLLEAVGRMLREQLDAPRLARTERSGWDAGLWALLESLGLPEALLPEAAGGSALAPAPFLQLVRLGGYHLLPLPLAETMLARSLWHQAGGADAGGPWSLAADPVRLEPDADGWYVSGTLGHVPWGRCVHQVLAAGRDAGGRAWLLRLPAAAVQVVPGVNLAGEPRDGLRLAQVRVDGACVRPAPAAVEEDLLAHGAVLRAQQLAGALQRALDQAVAYAGERKQFGRPIARFQAVQQMLAEAAGHCAAAAAAADLVAPAWDGPGFLLAVAMAKARTSEAAGRVAETCHQVHGAIGFTQEHPLHFTTRRLWSWREEYGHEPLWQERIGRLVCAAGGEALWPLLCAF